MHQNTVQRNSHGLQKNTYFNYIFSITSTLKKKIISTWSNYPIPSSISLFDGSNKLSSFASIPEWYRLHLTIFIRRVLKKMFQIKDTQDNGDIQIFKCEVFVLSMNFLMWLFNIFICVFLEKKIKLNVKLFDTFIEYRGLSLMVKKKIIIKWITRFSRLGEKSVDVIFVPKTIFEGNHMWIA